MNSAATALSIAAAVVFGTIAFALGAVRRYRMEPQEYIVGGRSFGAVLLWILLAGEVYTSFTFLGAAGWAYGKGAAAFYIIPYVPIGFLIAYFYMPQIWRLGKARGLMTWPDYFLDRYGSKALAMGIALLQATLMVPYVTLQLTGLQILLGIAGYGQYNAGAAVAIAFCLIALFVFTAGIRGTAWAGIIKDTLVLGAAVFLGIGLPTMFFGSPGAMISHVISAKPHWLTLAAGSAPYGTTWFISTIALTSLGVTMFPQWAQSLFTAKDEQTVRLNLMFMPLYNVVMVLILLAGFTAMLLAPGLTGPAADRSYLIVLQRHFPAWVVGLICGAGALAALLPASMLLLGSSTVISRNVLGHTRWVRPTVLVCAALALLLWFFAKATLVDLLLFVFNGITQLFPAVILGLFWKRMTAYAAAAGIAAGEIIAIFTLHASGGPWGINVGLIALLVNAAVCVVLALFLPQPPAVIYQATATQPEN